MRLFPRAFRETFGDEMRAVFAIVIADAAERGIGALTVVSVYELGDMLVAATRVRRMTLGSEDLGTLGVAGEEARLSRKEMLVALAVFLIPAGLIFLNNTPPTWISYGIPLASFLLLFTGLATGLTRRLPRWSLAYLGLVLSAVVFVYLFQWEAEWIGLRLSARFSRLPGDELTRLLLNVFWQGVVWLTLLLFATAVYLLLALLPRFRTLIRRLEEDWTRLSYLLYSGSMVALLLAFDEYSIEETYALVAVLALTAGAWGYLRGDRPAKRFFSLLTGVSLAMSVVVVGKWLLVPNQDWMIWFTTHPPERERWLEAGTALIGWAWMVVILALPALLCQVFRLRGLVNRPWAGHT
jgi:hypothetical protein